MLRPTGCALLLCCIAAGCASGTSSADSDTPAASSVASMTPVASDPPAERSSLPTSETAAVVLPAPAATAREDATAAGATVASSPGLVEFGTWDWGVPCRVPVEQTIAGSGPLVTRSFEVVVSRLGDGFLLEVDDVVVDAGSMTDAELAAHLLERGALLPAIVLDSAGEFVEFVDLDDAIADTMARAGLDVSEPIAITNSTITHVRHATIGSWFDWWSDVDAVTSEPVERLVDGAFLDVDDPARLRVGGEMLTATAPDEPPRVAVVFRYEFGDDLEIPQLPTPDTDVEVPDGDPWYYRVEAATGGASSDPETITINARSRTRLDVDRRRPLNASSEFDVRLTTGELNQTIFGFRITSDFDWQAAAGCA